jgi:hypothetical protein
VLITEFRAILQAQHLDTNIQVVLYLLDYYWEREGERPQSSTLDATADEDGGDTDGDESVHDLELAGLGAETA